LLWIGGSRRSRIASSLAFAAGCALILLPVGLRNFAIGGEFHLTTSQFGPNFYIGNHPGATGVYEALVAGHGSAADEREDATAIAELAAGRTLSPGEVSGYWTRRAIQYIQSQPFDWLKLMARKFALTFNSAEVSDSESQAVYAEESWLLRILSPFDFGILLGLAAAGAVITAQSWRRIWFLYAMAGAYAVSVVVFYVFARYRFPLVPPLLLLAAGGVAQALAWAHSRDLRRFAVPSAAALTAIVFAHIPLDDARVSRATHYADVAASLSKNPERLDDAMQFYKRALNVDPNFPAAQFGVGTLLERQGRLEEAIPYYRAAIASWPDYADARYNLGVAFADSGRLEEAAQQYTEAIRIRPGDAASHNALAKTLLALHRPNLALHQYEAALVINPKDVTALVGLGVTLTQLGRAEEAVRKYEAALELAPQDFSAHNNLGFTLANLGRVAEAVPHFERALALKPGDENATRNLEQARQYLNMHPK